MAFQERFLNAKGSEKLFGSGKFAGLPVLFDDQYVKGEKITGMKTRKQMPISGSLNLTEDLAYFSTDDQVKVAEKNFQQTYGGHGGYAGQHQQDEDEDEEYFDEDEEDEDQ